MFSITVIERENSGEDYEKKVEQENGRKYNKKNTDLYYNDSCYRWVLCRVGNTGRQIRLLVLKVPAGCRQINIAHQNTNP